MYVAVKFVTVALNLYKTAGQYSVVVSSFRTKATATTVLKLSLVIHVRFVSNLKVTCMSTFCSRPWRKAHLSGCNLPCRHDQPFVESRDSTER